MEAPIVTVRSTPSGTVFRMVEATVDPNRATASLARSSYTLAAGSWRRPSPGCWTRSIPTEPPRRRSERRRLAAPLVQRIAIRRRVQRSAGRQRRRGGARRRCRRRPLSYPEVRAGRGSGAATGGWRCRRGRQGPISAPQARPGPGSTAREGPPGPRPPTSVVRRRPPFWSVPRRVLRSGGDRRWARRSGGRSIANRRRWSRGHTARTIHTRCRRESPRLPH